MTEFFQSLNVKSSWTFVSVSIIWSSLSSITQFEIRKVLPKIGPKKKDNAIISTESNPSGISRKIAPDSIPLVHNLLENAKLWQFANCCPNPTGGRGGCCQPASSRSSSMAKCWKVKVSMAKTRRILSVRWAWWASVWYARSVRALWRITVLAADSWREIIGADFLNWMPHPNEGDPTFSVLLMID